MLLSEAIREERNIDGTLVAHLILLPRTVTGYKTKFWTCPFALRLVVMLSDRDIASMYNSTGRWRSTEFGDWSRP